MKELWKYFFTFCRIGGLTFGGGYAMLPMLQKEVVERNHWATEDELMDYFAIGQCTPGVIAVNTATFIGYKNRGVLGAIFATVGIVFPSVVIVVIIAACLQNFAHIVLVQQAFSAIRVVVGVLIVNAVYKMWQKTVIDKVCGTLAVLGFLASAMFHVSPVGLVFAAGIFGVLYPAWKGVQKS